MLSNFYGLCDPDSPASLRYIGTTDKPIYLRVRSHLALTTAGHGACDAWLLLLQLAGRLPLVSEFEPHECGGPLGRTEHERKLIDLYSPYCRLLNTEVWGKLPGMPRHARHAYTSAFLWLRQTMADSDSYITERFADQMGRCFNIITSIEQTYPVFDLVSSTLGKPNFRKLVKRWRCLHEDGGNPDIMPTPATFPQMELSSDRQILHHSGRSNSLPSQPINDSPGMPKARDRNDGRARLGADADRPRITERSCKARSRQS